MWRNIMNNCVLNNRHILNNGLLACKNGVFNGYFFLPQARTVLGKFDFARADCTTREKTLGHLNTGNVMRYSSKAIFVALGHHVLVMHLSLSISKAVEPEHVPKCLPFLGKFDSVVQFFKSIFFY